jgi:tyrosyl-tRNA synthetase
MKINFFQELQNRGILQDFTPTLKEELQKEMLTGYAGFDPTAASLHVGNLVPVMLLTHFQRSGHKPIMLVGGATGMIGDPSGKTQERKLLGMDEIRHNTDCIRKQLNSFLNFDPSAPNAAELVNNYDWYHRFTILDFLRDVGKHLTINYMSAKDSVKNRLETGISFTEFSYQLLQAYDFYYLYQNKNCKLQIGGADQWGNITSGIELIRKIIGESAHGITAPLLLRSDGAKFGKSESGNVWLDPNMTSPYKFYQFWLNVADEDMPKLLKTFSLMPIEEIQTLIDAHQTAPEKRAAQTALAIEMTTRIHGEQALKTAQDAANILFGNQDISILNSMKQSELLEIFEGVPQGKTSKDSITQGINIIDLLVETGAQPSKSEARRSLSGGAIRLNKNPIQDAHFTITKDLLIQDKFILIQTGKKKYHLVVCD